MSVKRVLIPEVHPHVLVPYKICTKDKPFSASDSHQWWSHPDAKPLVMQRLTYGTYVFKCPHCGREFSVFLTMRSREVP